MGNLRSDVESIHNSGQYLFSMISDILDFASIESGSIRLDPQPSDIGEIISNAVREIRPMVETQKKHLKIQIDVGIDAPLIWADRTRTFQVILNLLSNAIKFTDHGVIQIRAYVDSAYLVICVSDEGIGIAPEQQLVIFEKFRQVNGALTRQVGGTGLGLAICKQLIELQGGRIWVTCALGRGSSFCFSLPVLRESAYETPLH